MDQGLALKQPLRVAIVGGGWAGLAAAVELSEAGVSVTVFEAAKQIGGRARSVHTHGHALDNGQHILVGAYRETLRLMRKVGLDPERQLKRVPLELSYPGAGFRMRLPRLPAPLHLAIGLLGTRGSSLSEKLAAGRFMHKLQACNFDLDADSTVAELLDRHEQVGRLRQYVWEPLCLAALNTGPENASAQIFANVLRDSLGGGRNDTDLLLPATDLNGLFPDAAAAFINKHGGKICLSSRVEQIPSTLNIYGKIFDHVILAVAPQHATVILAKQTETEALARTLAGYSYEPIGTTYIAYPPEVQLPSPMLGLNSGTNAKLGQWVFDRGILGGKIGILGFVLSARGAWDDCDAATLSETLHRELQDALGRTLPQPLWHQVIREQQATFSCRPNLTRPTTQTQLDGLWLAGDYVCADYPATLEGAVRSGITAADRIKRLR